MHSTQITERLREPIAIIGSSCRFPGSSSSPSKLWELLSKPRDVLKEFHPERLNLERFYHKEGDTHGATDVTNKSYLLEEDSRLFDYAFFGISPMEAAGMDPQQRILLETVFEVFESAGITLEQLRGSLTSVHVGVMTSDYANIQARDTETIAKYNATGSANSIMSNRISYVFDLKGPSETIDTACSSSLVALHNAALSLTNGDCDSAIVCGVNLIFDPAPYINESKLHMLSPESRSRMWDKAANGYARGEGAGAVFLKTLSQALKDGDHIEGILRSTGVNSDGQSPGITMPFAPTQTDLVRRTYAHAGLDPIRDRPQYIECHGTGTPAGDPVEAKALYDAFCGSNPSADETIYVGSIKTVIGHLEGGAGLAGVLKVLLAMKHRVIPPNLLFDELNPAIARYYGPLQITTKAVPWPRLAEGAPARASVNSFGFGGTNAHAIIESYEACSTPTCSSNDTEGILGPLLFSAKSGASLLRTVESHLAHLQQHASLDLRDLSFLSQTRRTTHRTRAHFSGSTREAILDSMSDFLAKNKSAASNAIGHEPKLVNAKEKSCILGVFTGQGAQWPAMGRKLIESSPIFRRTIESCETVLADLPEVDRPTWSLIKELTADSASSRIAEAAISQPLCTAVQLALVDLLSATGVSFDAVVGHSSGEIAATYASGIINIKGAMQIAYYRGLHAHLAQGVNSERGGMMAAGIPLQQAKELCSKTEFCGRIRVAASNAPRSVTLSGDLGAINQVKAELEKENVFVRLLKVDTAYHSHHMVPCAAPYLKSLLACNIEVRKPTDGKCIWNSSVRGDTQLLRGDLESLKGQYWVDNMVRAVMFSQAIESSIWHGGPFDLVVEVGPHPALKGPTEQTLKASYGAVPVYTGVLSRGNDDVAAFSSAIGVTWSQLGALAINFSGYRSAFYAAKPPVPKIVKGLPTYAWDHDKVYWRESRMSRRYRLGKDRAHELLGRRTLDDNEFELRWRNVLKLDEMSWLRGHEVLDEVLLPGASYVSIAVEAAKALAEAGNKSIRLLEAENIHIIRPVVVPDNKDGVETLFTARILETTKDIIRADFSYYVCPDPAVGSMFQTAKGSLVIHLETQSHQSSQDLLPSKEPSPPELTHIDTEQVYGLFRGIGLNYTGAFRSITAMSRSLNYANAVGSWSEDALSTDYVLHPAMLDVSFQTLFVAKAHPASRQITAALLPSHIDRVRVNPSAQVAQHAGNGQIKAEFETWALSQSPTTLKGDLNIYDASTGRAFLQVEGLTVNMVGAHEASEDRSMFSKTVWSNDASVGVVAPGRDEDQDTRGLHMAHAVERVALFYVKRLMQEVPAEERQRFQWYHQRMFEAFEEHVAVVKRGDHPIIEADWLEDEPNILGEINSEFGDTIDLKLLHAVGENLADVVRGKAQLLEVMTKDDMLNRFYMEGYASVPTNKFIGDVMRQLTFKFPRSKILEIGAGTGGTSWSILNAIEDAYDSYTYTDISSGFFLKAAEKFNKFSDKMLFKVLDVESDPADQDFEEQSYDIIVAALVLHATHDLEKTLRHARSLLKPGGYLVMMELTGTLSVRATFIMGGLPGWWLGEKDGRRLSPLVTSVEWDGLLRDTGFSGVDTAVYDLPDENKHCTSLILSQAVDDDFLRLREPLSCLADFPPPTDPILIVGGKKLWTSKMRAEIQKLFPRSWKRQIQLFDSIDTIDSAKLGPGTDVIMLQDADETVFAAKMTPKRLEIIQSLLMNAKNMLWMTSAGKQQVPRASMIKGITRVVPAELPHLNIQVVGVAFEMTPATTASHCVEAFFRLRETGADDGSNNKALWAQEPELEILADGTVVIPRVIPDATLNELYNASKRSITKTVDCTNLTVEAITDSPKVVLQAANIENDAETGEKEIIVTYALHIPGKSCHGMYLVCGRSGTSWVMALSQFNRSVVRVQPESVIDIQEQHCSPEHLDIIAHSLLAHLIVAKTPREASVLVYEADELLAMLMEIISGTYSSNINFVRTESGRGLRLHAFSSKRAVLNAVPHDTQVYVDCTDGKSSIASILSSSLPAGCLILQLGADAIRESQSGKLLKESYSTANALRIVDLPQRAGAEVIKATDLAGALSNTLEGRIYTTDWQARESMRLTVQPLNTQGLFKPNKTYFMAGMAGGLGLSICKWMIRQGAKHMVITSRNPQVHEATLEEARRAGTSLRIMSMDLTSRESVEAVVKEVQQTMPPIAGVCNAAMVLKDGFFIDMDAEQLNNTLAAKVIGSENLDSVFAYTALDFFILLGSVASVIGNVGQSNYHAANMFMASLVHQRRSKGLAGSVIHIAYVTDVGYVTREERDRQLDSHFKKVRLMPTSETDVHHAFAEAVRGGVPGSLSGSNDIIMGIEPLQEHVPLDQQPLWMKDPRFAYFTSPTTVQSQRIGNDASDIGNVRQAVDAAASEEEAISAVSAAFSAKLESILQLSVGGVDISRPVIDLGIDSLVAVEIRTWFLKDLGADVSVVKILGGDTVEQISTVVAKTMMAKKVQNDARAGASAAAKQEPPVSVKITEPTPSLPVPHTRVEKPIRNASPVILGLPSASGRFESSFPQKELELDSIRSSDIGSKATSDIDPKDSISTSGSSFEEIEMPGVDTRWECSSNAESGDHENVIITPELIREQPMSSAQSRLWFLSKHLEDHTAYNMVFRYRVAGEINVTRLRHAISVIIHQHEALRTCFYSRLDDGHPMQGIIATSQTRFRHLENANENTIIQTMKGLKERNWALEMGETSEFVLLSQSLNQHDLLVAYHHIVMDVVGLGIVMRDLNKAYQMQVLPKVTASYLDYSAVQFEKQRSNGFHDRLDFWKTEFATLPDTLPLLPMASVNIRPENPGNKSHHQYREVNGDSFTAIKKACQRLRISPFHFHLAVLQVLVSRYTGMEDICIGIVDGNRAEERFTSTVGFFVNMIPIRSSITKSATFSNIATRASQKALEIITEQAVPLDVLLESINAPRSSDSTPLFQVALNYRTGSIWEMALGKASMEIVEVKDAVNPFDISLGIAETPLGCMVELSTLSALYSDDACGIILDSYMRLLHAFTANTELNVSNSPAHEVARVDQALALGTGPDTQFSWASTLSQQFLDMCSLYPSNIAVNDGCEALTYSQLATKVNDVAESMLRKGCSAVSRVAVLCEPSVASLSAMLAILHIGAAYIPLDTSLPTSRHASMLQVSRPDVILYHSITGNRLHELRQEIGERYTEAILLDEILTNVTCKVPCLALPETTSIILFTSGSTGTPKGIMLSQRNFINHLALKSDILQIHQETVLQQSSLGFDMALIQIFCALANGGRLIIVPSSVRRDPIQLPALISREKVNLTIATPSEYLSWLNYGENSLKHHVAWRNACMGGEPVPQQLRDEFERLGLRDLNLINCYGPTEITAAATFQTLIRDHPNSRSHWQEHAVGKALPNYSVRILDPFGNAQPTEHTGEICIGGTGVALGYLGLKQETQLKFIETASGERLYRTGDQGRLCVDGTLLCLGRLEGDTQIKLRGLRVELQEIEAAVIKASGGLLSSVVVSQQDSFLIAHATLARGRSAASKEAIAAILEHVRLPQYFIPAVIIVLPKLPINANGKIDRKAVASLALPMDMSIGNTGKGSGDKMTIREGELRLLWERVLPKVHDGARINSSSDFFLLGGNSMVLMKLQAAIKESMNVMVSTRNLYQSSTLRSMADAVNRIREMQAENEANEEIDWNFETTVPKWLLRQLRSVTSLSSRHKSTGKQGLEVVLTGATSFLGGHLLRSLLQSDKIRKIHCIAVIADEIHLLPSNEKIQSYRGSLLSPTLGLKKDESELLSETADVIVHAGSNGHCLNTYASVRTPNVLSTHFLASIALPRSVPFILLSSNRVALLSGSTTPPAASVASYPPATDGLEGHMMSRWASEGFLENFAKHLQAEAPQNGRLPWTVSVHRPSVIVSDEAPNSDALNAILRYSVAMKCVPRLDRVSGYLDLVKLDQVVQELSSAVVELGLGENGAHPSDSAAAVRFQHHSGNIKVPISEFRSHMETTYTTPFREVEMQDWIALAAAAGIDPLITAYLEGILEKNAPMVFPYMGMETL